MSRDMRHTVANRNHQNRGITFFTRCFVLLTTDREASFSASSGPMSFRLQLLLVFVAFLILGRQHARRQEAAQSKQKGCTNSPKSRPFPFPFPIFAGAQSCVNCPVDTICLGFTDACRCGDRFTMGDTCSDLAPCRMVTTKGVCYDNYMCWSSSSTGDTGFDMCCPTINDVPCSGSGDCLGWGTANPRCVCKAGSYGRACRPITKTLVVHTNTVHIRTRSSSLSKSSTRTLTLTRTDSISGGTLTASRTRHFVTKSGSLSRNTKTITQTLTRSVTGTASRRTVSRTLTLRSTATATHFGVVCYLPRVADGEAFLSRVLEAMRVEYNSAGKNKKEGRSGATLRMQKYVSSQAKRQWSSRASCIAGVLSAMLFALVLLSVPMVHSIEQFVNFWGHLFSPLPLLSSAVSRLLSSRFRRYRVSEGITNDVSNSAVPSANRTKHNTNVSDEGQTRDPQSSSARKKIKSAEKIPTDTASDPHHSPFIDYHEHIELRGMSLLAAFSLSEAVRRQAERSAVRRALHSLAKEQPKQQRQRREVEEDRGEVGENSRCTTPTDRRPSRAQTRHTAAANTQKKLLEHKKRREGHSSSDTNDKGTLAISMNSSRRRRDG